MEIAKNQTSISSFLDVAAIRKTLVPTNVESFEKSRIEMFKEYCHSMALAEVQASCTQQCTDEGIRWAYMCALADVAEGPAGDYEFDAEIIELTKAWRKEATSLKGF
jgi:hypothetical protein